MFLSSINYRITSSLSFLHSVGYSLFMGLVILNIVVFLIYRTITSLTLLSLDGSVLSTTPIV